MSDRIKLQRPDTVYGGLVPTMNHRGFMSDSLDYYAQRFVEYSGSCDRPVLDIGCAYGIATRAALDIGATVVASDMEQRHLDVLLDETPDRLRGRLTTRVGELPGVEFPPDSFDAILCSRLLHFLLPDEIRLSLRDMHGWLTPGGRVFLIVDTPYTGFWFSTAEAYEQRKSRGEPWPGFIEDISGLLKDGLVPEGMPRYLNPMDPDILTRECERAGMRVVEASFSGRDGRRAGRQHAGVIAERPA
jgi:SAM-dependent methyltransferase